MPSASEPAGGQANRYRRVLLATLLWPAVNLLVILVALGSPGSVKIFTETVLSMLVSALLAALIAWLIVRRRAAWPWWKLAFLALPFWLVFRVLTSTT